MADAKVSRALGNLVTLGALTRTGADALLAHSGDPAQRTVLIMHWKAADERAQVDPKTAERIRHELAVIIEALGWHLGIDSP